MFGGPELIDIDHAGVMVIVEAVASYVDVSGRRALVKTDTKAAPVICCGHIPWKWIDDITEG